MQKLERPTRQYFVFINRIYDLKIPQSNKQVKYLIGKLHIIDQRNNIIATTCSRIIKTTYNYLNEIFINLQSCLNIEENCNLIFELVCQYRFRRVVTNEISILTRVIHLQDIDTKKKYPIYVLPYKLLKEERYNSVLPIENMNQNSANLSLVRTSPERMINYHINKKLLLDAKSTLSYVVTQYDLIQLPKNDFLNINKFIKQGTVAIKFLNSNITYYIKGEILNPVPSITSDVFLTDFQLHITKDYYQEKIEMLKESAQIKFECFTGQEMQADIDVTSLTIVFNDTVHAELTPQGMNVDVLHINGNRLPGDTYILQFIDPRHCKQLKVALNEKNILNVKIVLYYRILNMQQIIDPLKEQHLTLAYNEITQKRLFDVIYDLNTDIQLQFQATVQDSTLNANNYDEKIQKSLIPLTNRPPYDENTEEWVVNRDPKNQHKPIHDDYQLEEMEIEREIELRETRLQQILMQNREQRIRQIRIQYGVDNQLQPLKKNARNVRNINCRVFQIKTIGQTLGQNIYFKLIANTQQDETVEAQTCVLNRLVDFIPQQIINMNLNTCGDVTNLTFQVYDIIDENTSFLRGQLNINLDIEQTLTNKLAMYQNITSRTVNGIMNPDIDEATILEKLFAGQFLDLDLHDVYLEGNFSSKGQPIAQVQLQFLLRPVPDDPPQIDVSMTVDKAQNLSLVNQYQQNFLQQHGRIGRLAFAESLPKDQIYQQFIYLHQNTPVVFNLLSGFLVDNNEKLTLLLLNINDQKLKWFGIELKAQKQQLNVEYGIYNGIPSDLSLQMIFTPQSARERQLQFIKLQFLVYHQRGNLGVINVFVKRQLKVQSLANIVLQVPKFLGTIEVPLIFRYDVSNNQINIVSPNYAGKLAKLSQGSIPYKDEHVRIYNGKKFLCKSELKIYTPIQGGVSAVLSIFKDHQQVIKSRFVFLELNLKQEILYEIDDYLTFYSYFFTFTVQLLKTDVCEISALSGSYFSIPTFGSQNFLTLPPTQEGHVLAWGGGPQLIQVRTSEKMFCIYANVQETAVQKIFVKLTKDSVLKTIEFPFIPQLIVEDPSLIQIGKLYQNQNGQWNQELIFNIECVGERFVTVTKLIVVGDSWSQVWNLVVSL